MDAPLLAWLRGTLQPRELAHPPLPVALLGLAVASAVAVGLLGFACRRRSVALAVAACAVALLAGLWWQPWLRLSSAPDDPSNPANWSGLWEVAGAGWALVLLGGLGCLVTLVQLRRL